MTARRPRTVAQMYGAGLGPDELPKVDRDIDGSDFYVDVDLTAAAGVLVEALAAALAGNPGLWAEWSVLMYNQSGDPARRAVAVGELLAFRPVQRALTLRFTPETAQALAEHLEAAAIEPPRCDGTLFAGTRSQPAEGCPAYAVEGESFCPGHLPADDGDTVREYEL